MAMETTNGAGTVLVVDDERMVLVLARTILERSGYTVSTAASGHDAVALCIEADVVFDCAIVDYTMPGLDGRETMLALRNELPGLPVIVASGCGSDEIRERLHGVEANAAIQKPYRREALLAAVGEVMARR